MSVFQSKSIAMVFDLSLSQIKGQRTIDLVKKQVIEFIRKNLKDEDSFYLYHPDIAESVYTIGEQVGCVGNYETDGFTINQKYALIQSLLVLMNEDEDSSKNLILITDRRQSSVIEKVEKWRDKEEFDCLISVIDANESSIISLKDTLEQIIKDNNV